MADDPADVPENSPEKSPVNPMALPVADAARLLTAVSGEPVPEDMLQEDIVDGAPTNADGTLNLVHYAAWLVKEMATRNDGA
jgi:hypothetical protein